LARVAGDRSRPDHASHVCEARSAETYINAIGGQDLYDRPSFNARGVKLKFIKPSIKEYRQFGNEFVPGLSIIDVLMFNPVLPLKC
jgi:hypothetical protein